MATGCATFYQRTMVVQENIASGNFEQANKELEKDKKWAENNHRVLYFMNRGMVFFMMGEHEQSNHYFNLADYYTEDFQKNIGSEALALISNPMVRPYRPEDFEAIMIHYYKAMNFIALKDYESALIECRRVNIRLQQFNEKYKEHKNKYARDAFAHNLMGIIYQAAGDDNNAFIAYRNALEIYEKEYSELFNVGPPQQLKEDLLISARRIGFHDEVRLYEEKFGISASDIQQKEGDLVYIWMNGLGPVKAEWSLNLTNMGMRNGTMLFGSDELGTSFPISLGNQSQSQQAQFKNLSFVRVAFPKYTERPPLHHSAVLHANQKSYTLELAQNINKIAYQSLKDRMLREIGSNLLRLATKQAMEHLSRNENNNLGAVVSIVNAMTEKADTRNWQSLPYALHYTRIPLSAGEHNLILEQQKTGGGVSTESVNVQIQPGETTFQIYHQLGTR
jgi:uncharacterized protein